MPEPGLRALSPALGTEVRGIDPGRPLPAAHVRLLRDAYARSHLLLVRDVDLDADQQVRFCSLLGGVHDPASFVSNVEPGGFHPDFALVYHSDYAFLPRPVLGLCLHAIEIADGAAPTRFVSAAHGARTLPKELADRLRARTVTLLANTTGSREDLACRHTEVPADAPGDVYPCATRPALWPHPRTGEPLLFVNEQHGWRFPGLAPADSDTLFDDVFAHLYRPEAVYEHHWRRGDLIVWDNLALQHARPANPAAIRRSLRRVVLHDISNQEMVAGTVFDPARWAEHKPRLRRDDPATA